MDSRKSVYDHADEELYAGIPHFWFLGGAHVFAPRKVVHYAKTTHVLVSFTNAETARILSGEITLPFVPGTDVLTPTPLALREKGAESRVQVLHPVSLEFKLEPAKRSGSLLSIIALREES